jgi:hypothetical protein
MDTILIKAIDQRLHHVLLTNQIAKSFRAPFTRQYLITHEIILTKTVAMETG